MDAQLRQRFATRELEIANRVIAFRRCGIIARADKSDRGKEKRRGKRANASLPCLTSPLPRFQSA